MLWPVQWNLPAVVDNGAMQRVVVRGIAHHHDLCRNLPEAGALYTRELPGEVHHLQTINAERRSLEVDLEVRCHVSSW